MKAKWSCDKGNTCVWDVSLCFSLIVGQDIRYDHMRYRLTSDKWDVTLDILGAGAAVCPVCSICFRYRAYSAWQFDANNPESFPPVYVLGYLQYYLVVREKTAQAPSGQNQKYTLNSKWIYRWWKSVVLKFQLVSVWSIIYLIFKLIIFLNK